MNLRPDWNPPPVHINVISERGGLGDAIARLPAYRFMHDTFDHVSTTIYIQDGFYDLVRYLLPPTPRRSYRKLSEASWDLQKPIIEFDMERLTTLHKHLTEHAFDILMEMSPPSREAMAYPKAEFYVGAGLNYVLKDAGLATQPYIVFTTDFTAASRQWLPMHINTLAEKVRKAGLTPVLLGSIEPIPTGVAGDPIRPRPNAGIKTELFVDLRGKTSLTEALGVIQRAKAVVGLDNGLIHLAHCTDTPVVMGFTTLKPEHRVPVRDSGCLPGCHDSGRAAGLTAVLEAQVPCAGCQSRGFAINTDWRECVMPDRKLSCLLTLTDDRFYEKLQELNVLT